MSAQDLVQAQRSLRMAALGCALLAFSACSRGSSTAPTTPLPLPVRGNVHLGDCADPRKHGVVGEAPSLWRADHDLDGDNVSEVVVADRTLCTREGNCHWNLYRKDGECHRYLGTVSAAHIQRLLPRSEQGFFGIRAWWKFAGGERILMQEYRFRHGGYRLVDALLCRQSEGNHMVCAETSR